MTCATCKWYQVPVANMTRHRIPRIKPETYGQCGWPVPSVLPIALSVAGTRGLASGRTWMCESTRDCPTWEATTRYNVEEAK